MKEELFRKKSLDRVKSPENLDDYISVSNPSVWLLLISVIVLLIGALIWATCGHIDSTVSAIVRVENGEAVCYITNEDFDSVEVGMSIEFANQTATITEVVEQDEKGYTCSLSTAANQIDGLYEGKIVVDSYKPLSFIMN